jgi:hypothetical protein
VGIGQKPAMPLIVDDLIVGGVVGGAALYKYLTARGAANEEEREKAEHAEATKAASETPTVIVLGEQSVGKTCLMKRMCEDTFPEESNPTIGASFLTLKVELEDDKSVEFNVWDTAGQVGRDPLFLIAHFIVCVYIFRSGTLQGHEHGLSERGCCSNYRV